MNRMKFFIDTHDRTQQTFPDQLDINDFEGFLAAYEQACDEAGVVLLKVHVGLEEGRAFCFTMAPDKAAVQLAHEKVGLPFDSITEVSTATPGDIFFQRSAA